MPPDAPGCEAVRRLVPADKRHGSAQPGSGHCGHVVEIDHAVRFSFPALLARNMRTSNENSHPCRTAELHEGRARDLRSVPPCNLAECLPVRVLLRRLVAHVQAGPRRLIANSKDLRIPHAGACQRARASATDAKVRCGGCGLVLCVQHGFRVRRCARSGLVMQW